MALRSNSPVGRKFSLGKKKGRNRKEIGPISLIFRYFSILFHCIYLIIQYYFSCRRLCVLVFFFRSLYIQTKRKEEIGSKQFSPDFFVLFHFYLILFVYLITQYYFSYHFSFSVFTSLIFFDRLISKRKERKKTGVNVFLNPVPITRQSKSRNSRSSGAMRSYKHSLKASETICVTLTCKLFVVCVRQLCLPI